MSNQYFDWRASAERFAPFDTVRSRTMNAALDQVSVAFDMVAAQSEGGGAVTLADGAIVNWDMEDGRTAVLTLSTTQSARLLATPAHIQPGSIYTLIVKQGILGGETITAFGSVFLALHTIALNTAPNAVTALMMFSDGSNLYVSQMGAISGTGTPEPAPPPGPTTQADTVFLPLANHRVDYLETGLTQKYWLTDGRWGLFSSNPGLDPDLTEGAESWQYEQVMERSPTPNPEDGSVAGRWRGRWPEFTQSGRAIYQNASYSEIKAFPSFWVGKKPGYSGSGSQWPSFVATVKAADGIYEPVPNPEYTPTNIADYWQTAGGSVIQTPTVGRTPGTALPIQLPLTNKTCRVRGKYKHFAPPTGKGHLTFDIWLTAANDDVQGHLKSSLTHEIMIPLNNWGQYGQHGQRNPSWYSHDWTSSKGVLYHVYCTKDSPVSDITGVSDGLGDLTTQDGFNYYSGLRYNFGGLETTNGYINEETSQVRRGWKLIILQCDGDTHPLDAEGYFDIDLKEVFAHLAAKQDSRGTAFIQNTEYLASIELGVEPIYGTYDVAPYNYLVQAAETLVAPLPRPSGPWTPAVPAPPALPPPPPPPAPPPPPSAPAAIQTRFTAGDAGIWLSTASGLSSFFVDDTSGVAPTLWTDLIGYWINRGNPSNAHDLVQHFNGLRLQLGTDVDGRRLVGNYNAVPMKNVGASTTAFYAALAVNVVSPSYDCVLLSDRNAANKGIALEQEAFAAVFYAKFGTGSATVTCTSPAYAAGSNNPAGKVLIELWHDGTNASIRLNKGTPDTHACAAISAGALDMLLGGDYPVDSAGIGSSNATIKLYEAVIFKNYCPGSTDRDAIASYVASTAGLTL